MAHVITEADNSQYLQDDSSSWRRGSNVNFWLESEGLKPGELMVWVRRPARSRSRKTVVSVQKQAGNRNSPTQGGPASLFYAYLQVIGWCPDMLGRKICFTQSTHLNINLIPKHTHRNTQNNVWPNIWVPWGPIKLTHRINHLM